LTLPSASSSTRRWWVFAFATGVALAALASVSWTVLAHERFLNEQRDLGEREALLEAVAWRMQSALLPVLAPEWTRPPEHWTAVRDARGGAPFDSRTPPDPDSAVPSPRLHRPGSLTHYYFEWSPDAGWRSPHVPRRAARTLVLERAWSDELWLAEAQAELERLRAGGFEPTLERYLSEAPRAATPLPLSATLLQAETGAEPLLALMRVAEDPARVQGVLLDWSLVRSRLLNAEASLVRDARLIDGAPRPSDGRHTRLALLPIEIELEADPSAPPRYYATRGLLLLAWFGTALGLTALAVALASTLRESQRRGRFASLVSHELRSPLTTFRMMTDLLARDVVTDAEQRREYLWTLAGESERLQRVVDNVLQHTRLELRRASLATERLPISELLERLLPDLERRALAGGLAFDAVDPRSVEQAAVSVDVAAVEQVLGNLVDNALKYASDGREPTLHLGVEVEPKRVRIWLEDEGPGLPPGERARLFRAFDRGRESERRPGLGLGLALSRALARELGGDLLAVDPRLGSGARFELVLPRASRA
jgi:signal transduction histidine kinase